MKTIKDSILIQASRAKVWDVLTLDRYTRDWYSAFSPGSHAVTDWKPGSKAWFVDPDGNGMAAKVTESEPGRTLVVEFTGLVMKGKEDLESAEAQVYKGGYESYRLSEEQGAVRLHIASDMEEAMYESMAKRWEKALERLKQLAEQHT